MNIDTAITSFALIGVGSSAVAFFSGMFSLFEQQEPNKPQPVKKIFWTSVVTLAVCFTTAFCIDKISKNDETKPKNTKSGYLINNEKSFNSQLSILWKDYFKPNTR